jgi:hypothetical protein
MSGYKHVVFRREETGIMPCGLSDQHGAAAIEYREQVGSHNAGLYRGRVRPAFAVIHCITVAVVTGGDH